MKNNVLVDGNYILMKTVFNLNKMRELDKLKVSLTYQIKNIMDEVCYDNFILVSDSSNSWRKSIYPEYKANRKDKDDTINWEMIFRLYDEFKDEITKDTAIKVIQSPRMEGDDVISQIVQKSNLKGYSNIIVASDRDFCQILNYSYSPDYINIMVNVEYKNSKIYLPLGGEEFLEKLRSKNTKNIFFMSKDNSHFIRYVDEQMAKREVIETFGEERLFNKIISGDGKDNVDSTYYKYNEEKGTKRGIGEKTAIKIYNRYKEIHPEPINFKTKEFIIRSKNFIAENKKIKEEEILKEVQQRIILNTKLIMLDESFIPKDYREELNNKIEEII